MALVNMRDMLYHAYHNGYAVGAFDLLSLEFLEGIIAAAERCHAPVILSLTESYVDFELIMPAVEAAAKRATVPISIHLNHAAHDTPLDSAVQGINLGCNGIKVDASHHGLAKNIQITRTFVEMAHACGVAVEGEPGYTTAAEAEIYAKQTGVDFLTIAIGTVHDLKQNEPKLDDNRLQQINQALRIPLVIHGDTGLSEQQIRHLITNGVAKINVYTALTNIADGRIRDNARLHRRGGYSSLLLGVKESISTEVERCMRLWGSIDRAAELLVQCTAWSPVEHVIIYNVTGITEQDANAMMAKGQQALSTIPGVRELISGRALKEDAAYRYTWLVRFCHPAVIDSYRNHPAHLAFADQHFRPVAANRISIDYQRVDTLNEQAHEREIKSQML